VILGFVRLGLLRKLGVSYKVNKEFQILRSAERKKRSA